MMLNIHAKSPTKLQKDPPTCRRVEEVVVVVVVVYFVTMCFLYGFTDALLLSSTILALLI
jgi:hypothetical protein